MLRLKISEYKKEIKKTKIMPRHMNCKSLKGLTRKKTRLNPAET
jgi:hypothetical protein